MATWLESLCPFLHLVLFLSLGPLLFWHTTTGFMKCQILFCKTTRGRDIGCPEYCPNWNHLSFIFPVGFLHLICFLLASRSLLPPRILFFQPHCWMSSSFTDASPIHLTSLLFWNKYPSDFCTRNYREGDEVNINQGETVHLKTVKIVNFILCVFYHHNKYFNK